MAVQVVRIKNNTAFLCRFPCRNAATWASYPGPGLRDPWGPPSPPWDGVAWCDEHRLTDSEGVD